jgi:hypothetical protein
MSFGFSVSDLIMGSQLAYDIYQQCFTKARGAGEWYLPLLLSSVVAFSFFTRQDVLPRTLSRDRILHARSDSPSLRTTFRHLPPSIFPRVQYGN